MIFSYDEIFNLFLNEYYKLPFTKRIPELIKHMSSKLKKEKERLIEQFNEDFDRKIKIIKLKEVDSEERQRKIIKLFRLKIITDFTKFINNFFYRIR